MHSCTRSQLPGTLRLRRTLSPTGRWRTTGTKDDMHITWPMRIAPAYINAPLHFTCLSESFSSSSPLHATVARTEIATASGQPCVTLSDPTTLSDLAREHCRLVSDQHTSLAFLLMLLRPDAGTQLRATGIPLEIRGSISTAFALLSSTLDAFDHESPLRAPCCWHHGRTPTLMPWCFVLNAPSSSVVSAWSASFSKSVSMTILKVGQHDHSQSRSA